MGAALKNSIKQAKRDKQVLAIAVFGSYARGEHYRDIDVCVFLTPRTYSEQELSLKKMEYVLEDEKYDVQIFQQLPLYIRKRILKEAKILYCRDEGELYDLYFEAIRDFDHFQHIYEGYLEAVEHG